jgi:hypothetical protein
MSNYRDQLVERFGQDIGSVVGCALDRLERPCSAGEIDRAIDYYKANQAELSAMPIGARRDKVARYIEPSYGGQ